MTPGQARVLEALRGAGRPLDAAGVAAALGVHVTTARFHLDRLVEAGLAITRSAPAAGPGRPRILFEARALDRDEASRARLIGILAGMVAEGPDPAERSREAGRRWAADSEPLPEEDPAAGLLAALDGLGFEPEAADAAILLRACPFREAAREHPQVVCAVHRGHIEGALEPTALRGSLTPFPDGDHCVVLLAPA